MGSMKKEGSEESDQNKYIFPSRKHHHWWKKGPKLHVFQVNMPMLSEISTAVTQAAHSGHARRLI